MIYKKSIIKCHIINKKIKFGKKFKFTKTSRLLQIRMKIVPDADSSVAKVTLTSLSYRMESEANHSFVYCDYV